MVRKVTKSQTRQSAHMASQWQLQLEPGTPPLTTESSRDDEAPRLHGPDCLQELISDIPYSKAAWPFLYTCRDRELTTYLSRQPAHGSH